MERANTSQQSRLPVELYILIISHLHSPADRHELYALALSSKALSDFAIRRLYQSVWIPDREGTQLLFKRIGRSGRETEFQDRSVATFVHEISFPVVWNEPPHVWSAISDGLQLLHQLRQLEIRPHRAAKQHTVDPPLNLDRILRNTQFRLTHLSLSARFHYDNLFEEFLNQQSETLKVLRLQQPSIWGEQPSSIRSSFMALDVITAPAYCLNRLLVHSQPTKVWNVDGGLVGIKSGQKRNVRSYKGNESFGIMNRPHWFVMFSPHLHFLKLNVRTKLEVRTPYFLRVCRALMNPP